MYVLSVVVIAGSTSCTDTSERKEDPTQLNSAKKPIITYTNTPSAVPSEPPLMDDGIIPAKLYIPALQILALVDPVSITDDGQMDVPAYTRRVGILSKSSDGVMPGAIGNAVMDGHVDSPTGPAVFFRLKQIKKGDKVIIKNKEGCRIDFSVEAVETYKTTEAPISKIFGPSNESRLNLITCTGTFIRKTKEYQERLVVYTKRKSETKGCTIKNAP